MLSRLTRSSILCVLILRGARDQAPNTMDMDTQPQGQQAAVPVFQPQVDSTYRHTHEHKSTSQQGL